MGWPKGKPRSGDERIRISQKLKGKKKGPMPLSTKEKISTATKGRVAWNKGLPMWWTPARSKGKPAWNRGKKGEYTTSKRGVKQPNISREKHWAWKGGVTPLNRTIRNSIEYREWRTAVFERDDYTCQGCSTRGGWLEADHIKQFAVYPELRLEVSNGRTLCRTCHIKTFKKHA